MHLLASGRDGKIGNPEFNHFSSLTGDSSAQRW